MQNSLAIANFFIKSSFATGDEVTPMKLIKLCYIAHGWHLGIYKQPLLDEPIYAWKFGPVVSNVYHKFKGYGNSQITNYAHTSDGIMLPDVHDIETGMFLQKIWDVYRTHDGIRLSAMTHQSGTPWDTVWNKMNGKDKKDVIIPNNIIQEYYSGLVRQNAADEPRATKS